MKNNKFLDDYIESEYRVLKEHTGMRADAFLSLNIDFFSRTRLKQKINDGQILMNGIRFHPAKRIKENDHFIVTWRKNDNRLPAPVPQILYEDEYILGVNKPAGVPVHPTGRKQSGTLIQGIHEHFKALILESLKQDDGTFYPRLINRLDLFTSGVVLVAKNKEVFVAMQELQLRKAYAKEYIALVENVIEEDEGLIDRPLGKAPDSEIFLKQAVVEDGLPSRTKFTVIERFAEHTLVRCSPITGRQHQIRVHCASIGHPVWGDLIYKDEALFFKYYEQNFALDGLPPRHALHCEMTGFVHPFTEERVEIMAPLADDFRSIVGGVAGD